VRSAALACVFLALSGATAAAASLPSRAPLAAITQQSGGETLIARADPLTLAPRNPTLRLGEYHDAWSFSPDGKRLVLGTSAGGPAEGRGIHIVDVASLRELSTIQVPIAVEALAWLSRRRIAGALQGDVFVADPVLGRVVMHRSPDGAANCSITPPTAVARGKLVLLYGHLLLTVGVDKRMRQVRLRGLPDNCSGGDVVVDRRRGRAYTVGAGTSVAEVQLRTMRARRRRLAGAAARGRYAHALWLGHRGLIAAAHCGSARSTGVELIDTRAWRRRVLDERACGVVRAGHTLLVFDGGSHGTGLTAFSLGGRPRWRLLRGSRVWNVQVAGRFAYAIGSRGVSVVDLRRHRVVHRSRHAPDVIEFLSPRRP
jgi:hypothetical protein